jgi:YVTN family beta-propeller protein
VDSVVAVVSVSKLPITPRYNTRNNRVYVAHEGRPTVVTVVDGAGDSVVRTIPLPYGGADCWYVQFNNRLYCNLVLNGGYRLAVIDCDVDTVVAVLTGAGGADAPVTGFPGAGKVYAAGYYGLNILDAWADTIIRTVAPETISVVQSLCLYEPGAYLLVPLSAAPSRQLRIFDATRDTLKAVTQVGVLPGYSCLDSRTAKYYVACELSDSVWVVDATTLRNLHALRVGRHPSDVVLDSTGSRVFVANYAGSSISVIHDTQQGLVESTEPAACMAVSRRRASHAARTILLLNGDVVFDVAGRRVSAAAAVGTYRVQTGPGVYFVRSETGGRPARVLICR